MATLARSTVGSETGLVRPGGGFGRQQLGAGAQRRQRRTGGERKPVVDEGAASESSRPHKSVQTQFRGLPPLSSEPAASQVRSSLCGGRRDQ